MQQLRALGAEVVDDVGLPAANAYRDAETSVLLVEMRVGLEKWLASFAPDAPVKNLADVILFNVRERAREMPHFGQEMFERAMTLGGLDSAEYKEALAACVKGARTDGLDRAFDTHQVDAVIAPTGSLAWVIDFIRGDHAGASFSTPAAVAGYPHLTVPCGLVRGLPLGLSFVGRPWTEARLLACGHACEQAARARRAQRHEALDHRRRPGLAAGQWRQAQCAHRGAAPVQCSTLCRTPHWRRTSAGRRRSSR